MFTVRKASYQEPGNRYATSFVELGCRKMANLLDIQNSRRLPPMMLADLMRIQRRWRAACPAVGVSSVQDLSGSSN